MKGHSNEEERGALDYARHHGLCEQYDSGPIYDGSIPVPSNDTIDLDLWDPSNEFIANAVDMLTRERLAVSREAVLLLRAVHELQQKAVDEPLATDRYHWMSNLKQELPILRTDNELDLLHFGSAVMPDLKDSNIPLEIVDQEKDEGLEWPAKYLTYPAQFDKQIKAEKLAVSRDVLLHLCDAIADAYTSEDYERIQQENLQYKPNTARRPVTPPLLPLSPPLTPYIPSSPANRLPLPSDSDNSVQAETRELEKRIMDADSLIRKSSDSSDSMLLDVMHPPSFSPVAEGNSSTVLKCRAEDLKVEGPLTPPILSDSPMKKLKSVTFPEMLHESIPDAPWIKSFDNDEDELNDGSEPDFDELFKDIAPYHRQATLKVGNEKLSGPDTTARVDVPDLDFALPVAPWNEYSQRKGGKHRPGDTELRAQTKFLLRMKREDLKAATSWHGLSYLDRSLPWGILTSKTSKINLDEKLHGETEFGKLHAEITNGTVATSSSQVWKTDGLRILDEEDEEDEIEPEDIEERRDIEALIRKRKLEIEEEAPKILRKRTAPQSPPHSQFSPAQDVMRSSHWNNKMPVAHKLERSEDLQQGEPLSQATSSRHKALKALTESSSNDLMFGGFSATSALHKFMETQGRVIKSSDLKSAVAKRPTKDTFATSSRALPVRSTEPSQDHVTAVLRPLPHLPQVPQHLKPCSFIISSAFLQQRSLIKQVEKLYQQAEIVYRDYGQPHSPAKEADILLSPSTGLILPTLQQIKQQSLPGQPDRSPVKERMTVLQQRYERLLVVVSEGLSHEMENHGSSRPEDSRDKDAIARYKAFASQLDGEVSVKYVPGGEQALARSVVVEMAKYGLAHGSKDIGDIKLMAAETTWEVFLRRVGINPFAAQVIVSSLKVPIDAPVPSASSSPGYLNHSHMRSVSGLPAFLLMSEAERIKFFQAFMGGSRILKRAGRMLDLEWISAAHGFRLR